MAASSTEDHLGKWIPTLYWVEKLKRALRCEVTSKGLHKALNAANAIGREFASTEDQLKYGSIVMIDATERRLVVGDKRKRIIFLSVVTDSTPGEGPIEANNTKFFVERLAEYSRRDSILQPLPQGFCHQTPFRH